MSSLAKLVIVAADGARRTYALHRYPVVIGRDPGCDITIVASDFVAPRHVRIEQSLLTGLPILVDLSNGGSTLYKGEQLDRHEVADRDQFLVADVSLMFYLPMPAQPVGAPHELELLSGDDAGQTVPLTDAYLAVGRRSANDLRLALRDVSGFHARFRMYDGVPCVEDLGSRNGTYVNGFRMEPRRVQALEAGDLVDIASVGVLVRPATQVDPIALDDPSSDDAVSLLPPRRAAPDESRTGTGRIRSAPAPRPDEPGDERTPYLIRRPLPNPPRREAHD